MQLKFAKMHGAGNDFVVLDGIDRPPALTPEQYRHLADRRFGIGCDQVLVLEPPAGGRAHARMRIFNTDGSEAGQCGNGVRCAAEFLRRRGLAATPVVLETGDTIVEAYGLDGGWSVNMGCPEFDPVRIPLRVDGRRDTYRLALPGREVEFAALSMGNPHAVLVVPDVDAAPVAEIAPAIQASGMFPHGVNVGFMQVLDPGHVRVRVYERGVGETLACGSGACAAVVAGIMNSGLAGEVDVGLKGGHLRVRWSGPGEPVWLTGPATFVFDGCIEL
jgi:diaminopimelate epimerase